MTLAQGIGYSLRPELIRAIYTCGLVLAPNESATFALNTPAGDPLTVLVRGAEEGVVTLTCDDEAVARRLRTLVGFDVQVRDKVACVGKARSG